MTSTDACPESLTFYPFAYALLDEELFAHCWYCLAEKSNNQLKKCGACKAAQFCDSVCQRRGWLDHKAECAAIRRVQGVVDVEIRLLGRIVSRHKLITDGKDTDDDFYLNRTSERSIMEVCSHDEDMRNDSLAMERLCNFYAPKFLLDRETIFQLHCRNYINRHAISDASYTREIGKGLYLDLCAYNHSCRPNVVYSCNGFIATMRPLCAGVDMRSRESSFYTYIDLLVAKQPRRKMLKDTWYFDCQCPRCIDDSEHILSAIRCVQCGKSVIMFGALANKCPQTYVVSCNKCQTPVDALRMQTAFELMRQIDTTLDNDSVEKSRSFADALKERAEEILADENVYLTRVYQLCIQYTQEEEVERALTLHLKALPCLNICYPPMHPTLAQHHYTIGWLFASLKGDDNHLQAQWHYAQAADAFGQCLGTSHPRSIMCRSRVVNINKEENAVVESANTTSARQITTALAVLDNKSSSTTNKQHKGKKAKTG